MNDKSLMKWGGICTFVFVLLFTASALLLLVSQGIPSRPPTMSEWAATLTGGVWRLFIPLFSVAMCLYVVVAIAAYDYLATTHYAVARIGLGFAVLLIIVVFLEIAVLGAGKIIAQSSISEVESQLFPVFAKFGTLHILAAWFHGLWLFFWGLGFVRNSGMERTIGAFLLAFSFLYLLYYLLIRVGNTMYAELTHSAGHVAMIVSHLLLGMVLINASKSAGNSSDE